MGGIQCEVSGSTSECGARSGYPSSCFCQRGALIHAIGDSVIATIGEMLATMLRCAAAAFLPIWCYALLLIRISQLPHDTPWFVVAFYFGDF